MGLHTRFLARQIRADGNVALRTERGFIICQGRPSEGFVDDFAVERAGLWDADGAALLLALADRLSAKAGVTSVRVVTAHADQPKVSMLQNLSLRLTEQWWVRELRPASSRSTPDGRVEGRGFSGIFGTAPPTYDPGGPVLLADRVAEDTEIAVVEREAAALGAVLAIIPATSGTAARVNYRGTAGASPRIGIWDGHWPPLIP